VGGFTQRASPRPQILESIIIQASIPDFLIHQAEEVAGRDGITVDSIISIALSSQVTAWKVRDTSEQRAARGKVEDLAAILANLPDVPPAPGVERE